jgi:quercetin dioxygenase-like cupin family protein
MKDAYKILLGAAVVIAGSAAMAQDSQAPKPDPTHIPFTVPKDIPWQGKATTCPAEKPCQWDDQTYTLFGDPSKPGIYGQLVRWNPGHFSTPHFHDKVRYITVISGTWWVSSSTKWDPNKTYPLHAGTIAQDAANTVHWDGSRSNDKEPAIIEIVGEGPVSTVRVDEDGKPLPAPPRP